jgi:transposase
MHERHSPVSRLENEQALDRVAKRLKARREILDRRREVIELPFGSIKQWEDWGHTLAVFRACLPRRGGKAENDRRFLEALHFFTVANVRWRACQIVLRPLEQRVERFDRLSKAGVFEAFFDALAAMSSSAHLIQMFDSTIVRAHVSAAGAKGGKKGRRSVVRAAASPRKSKQNRTPPATSSPST